jgi:Zn-dependent peptidase ImmA (M78 family)
LWGGQVFQAAFRKASALESDFGALSAWLRKGQSEGQRIECTPYDSAAFRQALQQVRSLTILPPEEFQTELNRLCAESGVAVVFVPELPKTRVSGATMWLSARKALIMLSLRYKSDDDLWFTFFHEAAHIILHGKRSVFVEVDQQPMTGREEQEANVFAANFLIPAAHLNEFLKSRTLSGDDIARFASRIGIAPGIVVGRLQHDGILPQRCGNGLKRRLTWVSQGK